MKKTLVLFVSVAAIAAAQAPSETRLDLGQKLQQNARDLEQYSYKRRLEIDVKGRSNARVDLVRYVDGKMETVPLETPQSAAGQPHGRGLRGMMIEKKIEKKKEEMKAEVERLRNLLRQYSPGTDSLKGAFEKASISRTDSGPDAGIKLVAKGIVKPNDSFTLLWSVADRRPKRIEIHTELDNQPVQMTLDFASLPDGPYYAAHTQLSFPAKDLRVKIDSSDYTHEISARSQTTPD